MSRHRKMLMVTLGVVGVSVLAISTAAFASLGPNVTVTGALKSGTKMTFKGDIDSVPITVSCTSFSATGKTGSSPSDSVPLSSPPSITGCTDSLGGTDTITTNQTNGSWMLSVKGKAMTLTIPKAGATFTSSVESGCTITAAPTKAAGVKGKYNDKNTDTVKNASIATSGSGCTSTSAKTSATVILTPAPGKPPWG
jgi:hypothetical protein